MVTQVNSAKGGIAIDEMRRVTKNEDVNINFLIKGIVNGFINIPLWRFRW